MRMEGWIMLIVSWTGISVLAVYTIVRTLRAKPRDLSAPLEIEARIEAEDQKRGDA
jgi:hypothetical protein